ncbi:MAG: ABC transporter permease [Cellvibrionales bacterium]|nr:ABC transporter permease [Cellvibrionales bacterium]
MRTPWEIQQAVVKALFVRELKTRFGSSSLGYAWAVIGPFLQIMVLVIIFSVVSRNGYQGLAFALFFAPGILLLNLFTNMANSGVGTVRGNKGLFSYKQVKPFDAFLTRTLLESTIMMVSFLVIHGAFLWYGYEIPFHDPLMALCIFFCMVANGMGFGLIFGSVGVHFKDFDKIISLLMRPLFFISCVIFPLIIIPREYHALFLWNPLVHAIELLRVAIYPHYLAPGVNIGYLFSFSIASLFIGMLFYRRNWRAMVAS